MAEQKFVLLGEISGAHGVRGEVKLRSFTENPEDIVAYGPLCDKTGARCFNITLHGEAKGQFIARIEGVTTRNEVESLRGTGLYVPREAIPDAGDEGMLIDDLIGMEVRLADGSAYGRVAALHNYGAGDILEIALEGNKPTELVSFTEANFPEIDQERGYLVFHPPEVV